MLDLRFLLLPSCLPLLLALAGCPAADDDSAGDDDAADDDSAGDDDVADDDSAGDDDVADDDSAGDDDVADDDDSALPEDCPDPLLGAALAQIADWPRVTSCASAYVFAGTEAEDFRLAVQFDLAGTPSLGQTFTVVLGDEMDPKDEVPGALSVQQGTWLMAYDCNDAIEHEPVVDREWEGIAGLATLSVTAVSGAQGWWADLALSSVVVRDVADTLASCQVPDVTLTDLYLGWLPG